MKKTKTLAFCLLILCLAALGARAQDSKIVKTNLSQTEIDRIIKSFTTKEGEFRDALTSYVFNRSAMFQTIGMGGQITGVYRRDSFMTFAKDGSRFEKILFFPMPTIKDLTFTPEDIENLGGTDQFAIEYSKANAYNFSYLGKEHIDELDLYVFDVSPKVLPDPRKSNQKFFSGRIWVDERDLQIVKSKGKAVPEGKDKNGFEQRFPIIETWRENVDGKYWFPSFAQSDDELVFDNGESVKIKVRVKYTDYRLGRSEVKILDDDDEVKEEKPTPTPKKP